MFYSKNPNSSCLSTKHAIARRMMTAQVIQRNIYSGFPLIASLEMSSICIIFLVLERRDCMCAYFDHQVGLVTFVDPPAF